MRRSDLALAALATAAVPGMRPVSVAIIHSAEEDPAHQSALVEDVTGRKWVIRSPLGAAAGAELERNDDLIAQLARHLPFKVPAAAGYADLGPEGRAAVYPYVEGHALSLRHLPPGQGLANAVGRAIAAVHNMPRELFEEFGVPVFDAAGYRSRKLAELDRAAETGHVPNGLLARWEQALEAVAMWQFATVPTHSSLDGSSFLVVFSDDDAASGRVVALTGWEQAQVADPAEDFARLVEKSHPRAVDAVFESYALARAQRPDGYLLHRARLASEMGLLQGLARAVGLGDDEFIRRRSDVLRKLDRLTANDDSLVPRTALGGLPATQEGIDEAALDGADPADTGHEHDDVVQDELAVDAADDIPVEDEAARDVDDAEADEAEYLTASGDGEWSADEDEAHNEPDEGDWSDEAADHAEPDEAAEPEWSAEDAEAGWSAEDEAGWSAEDAEAGWSAEQATVDSDGSATTHSADMTAPIPPPPTLPGDIAEGEGVLEVHAAEQWDEGAIDEDDPAVIVEHPAESSGGFEPVPAAGDEADPTAEDVADADVQDWTGDTATDAGDDDAGDDDVDNDEDDVAAGDTAAGDDTGPVPMFFPVDAAPAHAAEEQAAPADDEAPGSEDDPESSPAAEEDWEEVADQRLHTLYGMPEPDDLTEVDNAESEELTEADDAEPGEFAEADDAEPEELTEADDAEPEELPEANDAESADLTDPSDEAEDAEPGTPEDTPGRG